MCRSQQRLRGVLPRASQPACIAAQTGTAAGWEAAWCLLLLDTCLDPARFYALSLNCLLQIHRVLPWPCRSRAGKVDRQWSLPTMTAVRSSCTFAVRASMLYVTHRYHRLRWGSNSHNATNTSISNDCATTGQNEHCWNSAWARLLVSLAVWRTRCMLQLSEAAKWRYRARSTAAR